jgi:23S rRNA pseudouridine1911/1915/1917 synthase
MTFLKEKHIVVSINKKIRLNDYLEGVFSSLPSNKSIKKALLKGRILVDGKVATSALWVETNMKIDLLEDKNIERRNYDLELEIIYEDDDFAIVNKPAGLVSSGNQFRTLQNAVAGNLKATSKINSIHPPKLVHRLDSATSGLVIIAKTSEAVQLFGNLLAEKQIHKKYIAIVKGETEDSTTIDSKIGDKEASTLLIKKETMVSDTLGSLSWLELYPQTGRTHQLRIHLSERGHPILGDRIYGDKEKDVKGKGLFLAAIALEFYHPITKEQMKFEIPIPKKFQKYWDGVKKRNATSN